MKVIAGKFIFLNLILLTILTFFDECLLGNALMRNADPGTILYLNI